MDEEQRRALREIIVEAETRIYDYCSVECQHPWECEGCYLDDAKQLLRRAMSGIHLPLLLSPLSQKESTATNETCYHLCVLRGGK